MKKLLLYTSVVLALAACRRAEPEAFRADDRPLVPVSLKLDVAPAENGMAVATKTDYEPDDAAYDAELAVKSVVVLQFEWTDDAAENARLIHQYFTDDWATAKPVLATSNRKNTLIVVANVTGSLPLVPGTTYGEFLEKMNFNLLDSLDDDTGKGLWYYAPGSGNRYLRMSGCLEVEPPVTQAGIGSITLRRNCAKVNISIRNEAPASDKLVIDAIQFRSVNQRYYYYCGGPDEYSTLVPDRYDDRIVPFTGSDMAFYLPANKRGVSRFIDAEDTPANHSRKSLQPLPGATCVSIFGRYDCSEQSNPEDGTPIAYTYYLGANLTNDFNLEGNKKYSYTFVIPGKGTITDGRVDDMKTVILKDANSYMIHPPKQDGLVRRYSFPVRRAAVFWNLEPNPSRDITVGYYGGSSEEEYRMTEHSEWTAEVVWNDVFVGDKRVPNDALLETTGGVGFDPEHVGSQPYVTVKAAKGMFGNALIAIRKVAKEGDKSYGDIVWSWQLWYTDYDPDVPVTRQDGTYVYPVPGGEVHRYGGTVWNTTYADAFAMDRNLGANTSFWGIRDYYNSGAYYQHSRKDPLYVNGNPNYNYQVSYASNNTHLSPGNVRYTIHKPTIHLNNQNGWLGSGDNDVADKTKGWLDPAIDNPERPGDWVEPGKSVYDPCPPGWQVPVSGTYDGMRNTTTGNNRYREWDSRFYGIWYYPEGYSKRETTGVIYFPAAGHIIWNGGNYRFRNTAVDLYMEKGYFELDSNLRVTSNSVVGNPTGMPVRCVKKHQ